MKTIEPGKLHELSKRILMAAGADERNAEGVAEHLVSTNLCGVDTHGVWHLSGYCDVLKSGEVVGNAWPEILKETPTSALVSGNWGFGHISAKFAMEKAIEKAGSQNVAVVSLVQCHHTGRLGYYTEMASKAGMVSMLVSGGYGEKAPATVPYGGRERVFHTNPIAMGLPAKDGYSILLDFATTSASGVKIDNARNRNEELPEGWIVDKAGRPTTNPNDFFDGGGHVPFGGYKGWGLMVAAEFMSQVLTGSHNYADDKYAGDVLRYQATTMVVFKADMFQSFEDYSSRSEEVLHRVRSVKPTEGFDKVMVPGDKEAETRAKRSKEGIPIADDSWQTIVAAARSLGITDLE